MVPASLKIISVEVDTQSYSVKLSEPPGAGIDFTVYERYGSNQFQSIGTLTDAAWDTWLTLVGRIPGRTYTLIAVGNEGSILPEIDITLSSESSPLPEGDLDKIPDWLLTSSNKLNTKHEVGSRSQDWRDQYGE